MRYIYNYIIEKLTVNSKTKLHKNENKDNILSKIPNKILNGVYELAELFEQTILQSDNSLQEDDFEKNEDGSFNLMNVPQDGKLVKEFWNKKSSILNTPLSTAEESDYYKSIIIRNSSGDDIFIKVNIDTEDGPGYKKGDIISVDMSKEIKYVLLDK